MTGAVCRPGFFKRERYSDENKARTITGICLSVLLCVSLLAVVIILNNNQDLLSPNGPDNGTGSTVASGQEQPTGKEEPTEAAPQKPTDDGFSFDFGDL